MPSTSVGLQYYAEVEKMRATCLLIVERLTATALLVLDRVYSPPEIGIVLQRLNWRGGIFGERITKRLSPFGYSTICSGRRALAEKSPVCNRRIINEPTSRARYGFGKKNRNGAFYDLGGGTYVSF